MIYQRCGRSGLKLPALSLGLWHNFGGVDTQNNQQAMLRRAFDLGITHFDLANNYGPPPGSAEENFGKIFKHDFKPWRDELIISTKAGYTMWKGPYGDYGSRKYLLAVWIKVLSGWVWITWIFFIRIGPIRKPRSKKPWARWILRFGRERRFMRVFQITALSKPKRR